MKTRTKISRFFRTKQSSLSAIVKSSCHLIAVRRRRCSQAESCMMTRCQLQNAVFNRSNSWFSAKMKLKFNRFCNKDRKTLLAVFLIQIYPEMLLNKFSKNLHSNKCRWEASMLIRSPMAIIHEHQQPHRLSQTLHPAPPPRSVNLRQSNLQPKSLPQAGPTRRRRSRKILPTFRTSAKA